MHWFWWAALDIGISVIIVGLVLAVYHRMVVHKLSRLDRDDDANKPDRALRDNRDGE